MDWIYQQGEECSLCGDLEREAKYHKYEALQLKEYIHELEEKTRIEMQKYKDEISRKNLEIERLANLLAKARGKQ